MNSKRTTDVHTKAKTVKRLEENTGANLCDGSLGTAILEVALKAQVMKEKINKWDTVKTHPSSAENSAIEEVRRRPVE